MSTTIPAPAAPSDPTERRPGDAARLARWERTSRVPIILAAVIPLVGVVRPERSDVAALVVDSVSWVVFLVDLAVHVRLRRRYLRTGRGLFDLFVVIATFPWYLLPGISDSSKILSLLRVARLARVVVASFATGRAARTASQVNTVVVAAAVSLLACSLVAYEAEKPNNGFATAGDALWWGIVTLTTVGYGDIVPQTLTGRLAGAVLMITGIGLLGGLAGVLSGFFGLGGAQGTPAPADTATAEPVPDPLEPLHDEVARLRAQVEELNRRLAELPRGSPPGPS